ncbi:hypothetical protein FKW77_009261 [Venturia effusa]|uniref:Uncharacterized protein n=1 Tax=Venturia effusa TaxID=50376 RepID=A0A517L823_9PEZI|nr:hypothetical protein FKW77_009261 [Venturia effusa]
MVSPTSHTPASSGPQSSPGSTISSGERPPPTPPNSFASTSSRCDVQNAPPPTEFARRPRRSTLTHRARSDSISSLGKRSNPPGILEQLERIYEEDPGQFFEGPTYVPENTPKTSRHVPSDCSSPKSDRASLYPTVLNLPQLNEQLEVLPPPAASRFSSPPSSITGESIVSEPLMMAPRKLYSGSAVKPSIRSPLSMVEEQTPAPLEIQGGVREHSDWAENILQDLSRGLSRLSNLAEDDEKRDPSKASRIHYKERLNLLLNDSSQPIPYGPIDDVPYPPPAEGALLSSAPVRRSPISTSVPANSISWSEFKELKDRVEHLNQLVKLLTDMHSQSQKDISMLKSEASNLKKILASSGLIKATNSPKENDASKTV